MLSRGKGSMYPYSHRASDIASNRYMGILMFQNSGQPKTNDEISFVDYNWMISFKETLLRYCNLVSLFAWITLCGVDSQKGTFVRHHTFWRCLMQTKEDVHIILKIKVKLKSTMQCYGKFWTIYWTLYNTSELYFTCEQIPGILSCEHPSCPDNPWSEKFA